MKTVLLTLEYAPFKGGVANYYENLVKYWPAEIEVLKKENLIKEGVLTPWLKAFFSLRNYLKKYPDSQVLIGQVLPLGTVAWLNYLLNPYKYSVFLHGMDFSFALRKKRKAVLMYRSLRKADKIICANSHVANLVKEWKNDLASKIVICNPGIDNHDIPEKNSLKDKYDLDGKTILLSLGRLVKRKGVDKVLEALMKFDEEFKDKIVYIIAGQGEEEKYLKNLAAKLKTKVIFTGGVSEEDKWGLLDLCDIFIMPAREINGDFEGFGIVYLEANLCGKAVIAGRSGGISDAVSHNESGILVDPENVEEIGEGIKSLINNPEERKRLGLAGKERAVKNFKWSEQISKLYKEL